MIRNVAAALLALMFVFAAGARADGDGASAGDYTATVPVADTGDAARDAALAGALGQVLGKLAPQAKPGADVLGQAPGFVRNYRYQRAAAGSGLQLQVEFDPGSIQHLVQQLGASLPASAASSAPAADTGAAAAAPAQGGSGKLWVGGLHSGEDFAALLATLHDSPPLHYIVPIAAKDDGVLLQLDFDEPLAEVAKDLVAGGHLQAAPAHEGADASLQWTH